MCFFIHSSEKLNVKSHKKNISQQSLSTSLSTESKNIHSPALPNTQLWQHKFNSCIYFEPRSSLLGAQSVDDLSKLANYLNLNPLIKIRITGHTDNVSALEVNQKLSESRAQTVARYLINKGLNFNRIEELTGKNYMQPLGDNRTTQGRAFNRRVEILLLVENVQNLAENTDTTTVIEPNVTLVSKPIPVIQNELLEQLPNSTHKTTDVEIELDGLLVDDTKTKSGKDFYDLFYSSWEPPATSNNFSIIISEKPFRITNTIIAIVINENLVFQTILQPRQDIIESQAEEAIVVTQDYLINYQEIMKQLNGDDMAGSGIY